MLQGGRLAPTARDLQHAVRREARTLLTFRAPLLRERTLNVDHTLLLLHVAEHVGSEHVPKEMTEMTIMSRGPEDVAEAEEEPATSRRHPRMPTWTRGIGLVDNRKGDRSQPQDNNEVSKEGKPDTGRKNFKEAARRPTYEASFP